MEIPKNFQGTSVYAEIENNAESVARPHVHHADGPALPQKPRRHRRNRRRLDIINEDLNEYLPEVDPTVFDLWRRVKHGMEFWPEPGWMAHCDADKKWLEKVRQTRKHNYVTMENQTP